jgi:hypothetical protein
MNKPDKPALNRRTAMAGAGAVGALAAAASLLPQGAPAPADQAAKTGDAPADKQGYRLTEHIKQYYAKARI